MNTTYQFSAYPADYWRHGPRSPRWHFGCLSTFTFETLKEARKEVDRLKKAYRATDRTHLLDDDTILKIEKVVRTPVD